MEIVYLIPGLVGLTVLAYGYTLKRPPKDPPVQQLLHADGTHCWRGRYHHPSAPCNPPDPHKD